MTINEKVENLSGEINVKKKNQKEILQTKNINLRNYIETFPLSSSLW